MTCCPECGAERIERVRRGELLVEDSPPAAWWRGRRLRLSPLEAKTLFVIARTGRASYFALEMLALGEDSEAATVKVRVCKLRRKLREQDVPLVIVTEYGWGYKLEAC